MMNKYWNGVDCLGVGRDEGGTGEMEVEWRCENRKMGGS